MLLLDRASNVTLFTLVALSLGCASSPEMGAMRSTSAEIDSTPSVDPSTASSGPYESTAGNGCDPTIGPSMVRGDEITSVLYAAPESFPPGVPTNVAGVIEIRAGAGSSVSISRDSNGELDRTEIPPETTLEIRFVQVESDTDPTPVVQAQVQTGDAPLRWSTVTTQELNGASLRRTDQVHPAEDPRTFEVEVTIGGTRLTFWLHEDHIQPSTTTAVPVEAGSPTGTGAQGDSDSPDPTDGV